MSVIYNFDDLLLAIHNAGVEAQKLTEEQHYRQLKRYFDEDGTPYCQRIKIPNPDAGAEEEWVDVDIPLLALVPPSTIKIKEMSVDFKVKLRGFTDGKDKVYFAANGEKKTHKGPLQVDLGHGFLQKDSSIADVKIVFEGTEPPTAMLKLNDHLVKVIP